MTQAVVSMAASGQATVEQLPVLARKTDTTTVNASTTLVSVTGLSFAVGGGEVWAVLIVVQGASNSTADTKWGGTMSGAGTFFLAGATNVAAADEGGTSHNIASNGTYVNILRGVVVGGVGGDTFQLQFAQQTSDVSNSTVTPNSCIIAYRIA